MKPTQDFAEVDGSVSNSSESVSVESREVTKSELLVGETSRSKLHCDRSNVSSPMKTQNERGASGESNLTPLRHSISKQER